MKVNISKKLFDIVEKKYTSIEYVVAEVLPMISSESSMFLPRFNINGDSDEIEIDISELLAEEVYNYFSKEWTLTEIIQFTLSWGVLTEV